MTPRSSSSSSCCDAKKLGSISFVGALFYIAYVVFYEGSGGDVADRVGMERSATAPSLRAAPLTSTHTDAVSAIDVEQRSTLTYPQGPVIYKDKGPVTSINLLGERHSGTNWITDHLVDCVSRNGCLQRYHRCRDLYMSDTELYFSFSLVKLQSKQTSLGSSTGSSMTTLPSVATTLQL